MTTNNSNTNNQLIIPGGADFSIETTDGQSVTLPVGTSIFDYMNMNTGGGSNEPLYRMSITQSARDPRLAGGREGQFFLTRKVRVDDMGQAGQGATRQTETLALPGETITVWPIGYTANRAYMPKYDPNADDNSPLCRSENFVTPDARYAGKYAPACARLDTRTGRLVTTCPMAQWGMKDPRTGRAEPPQCGEQYIVCAALSYQASEQSEPEMLVVELYFKSASASAGKNIIGGLRNLESRGLPLWSYPIELTPKLMAVGITYQGVIRFDVKSEFTDTDSAGFQAATERWSQALQVRKERAVRLPEVSEDGGAGGFGTHQAYTSPAQGFAQGSSQGTAQGAAKTVDQPATKPAGTSKKAMI